MNDMPSVTFDGPTPGAPRFDPDTGEFWATAAFRGVGESAQPGTAARLAEYLLSKQIPPDVVLGILSAWAGRCVPACRMDLCGVVDDAETRLEGGRDDGPRPEHIGQVLGRVLSYLQSDAVPRVCPSPFPSLNRLLNGGFAPGELVYVGARPGVGKTAMALDFARAASKAGGRVLIVSAEMLSDALAMRMIAQEGHVLASALKTKQFMPEEPAAIAGAVGRLADRPMWLLQKVRKIGDIWRVVERAPGDKGWSLVIVDYLQLISAPSDVRERRMQVEAVSQTLKAMAQQFEVPVMCLSSLSRPPQGNTEPTLASLRESGELEHDADVVMLLHKPDEMCDHVKCRVAKNRNGMIGDVLLTFRGQWVTFYELAPEG